jgi:hypothetical protein
MNPSLAALPGPYGSLGRYRWVQSSAAFAAHSWMQDRWQKLKLPIDRAVFCSELDEVRKIRNDVMHFDPVGIHEEDLQRLRFFSQFLRRLHQIGAA